MNDITQPALQKDRFARLLVAFVWAAMTALLVVLFRADHTNVPLSEDWYMVPAFTGHEPDFGAWLWSQNNEHRVPLPRLVYLAILYLTGGSFAAVGWFNIGLQVTTAVGLILFLRRVRGHTDVADAFFPLQLLHWGHSTHFLFPFLISMLLPTAATLVLACAVARPYHLGQPLAALAASAALFALPLCGFMGLLYAPIFALILGIAAWADWTGRAAWPQQRAAGIILAVGIGLTLLVSGSYFIGYQTPWNPPSPAWRVSLQTGLRVVSMGFGVAPAEAWRPVVAAALVLLSATAWCVGRAVWRAEVADRLRIWGFALSLATTVAFAFAVGWSRSGWVPLSGIPSRYALLVVPAFASCFIAWVLFGPGRLRIWIPRLLALVMLALVPWNTRAGNTMFTDWYRQGMKSLHFDLAAGMPIDELARQHQPFLFHALTPEVVAERMRWLHEANVAPFDRVVLFAPKLTDQRGRLPLRSP